MRGGRGLLIHVDDAIALPSIASLLERLEQEGKVRTRGPVAFMVHDSQRNCRYKITTGREFPVNPQVKGALRSLRGVGQVEEV